MTISTSIRHLRSIAAHISTLEKDNAALRERVKHLEGICQSLAQHIEDESEASRWDDFEVSDEESDSDATTVGKPDSQTDGTDSGLPRDVRHEVSDKESVASNSVSESESESELESTTVEKS